MKRFLHAVAFLTRLPVPGAPAASAADVGRAALFFPAAGALIGLVLALVATALEGREDALRIMRDHAVGAYGATGDPLGAGAELGQAVALLVAVAVRA